MLNFEHKRTNDDQQGEELIPKERKRIEKEIIFYRKRKERKCQKEKTSRQKPKPSRAEPRADSCHDQIYSITEQILSFKFLPKKSLFKMNLSG